MPRAEKQRGIDPWSLGVSSALTLERDEIVIKRALPKLKVAADWVADPRRSSVEVQAIRIAAELLGQSAVPELVWENAAEHSFAMRRVDPRLRNWKQDLMEGRVDSATCSKVGELLGLLHSLTAPRQDVAVRFEDRRHFEDLRILPYFLQVARRNPNIRNAIQNCVDQILETRLSLVHGDFSPKNILQDGRDAVILDWEVAHWGDPRFDLAFCLSHLILKGNRQILDEGFESRLIRREKMLGAAKAFLKGYEGAGLKIGDRAAVRVLACLILARLEGDSPVEYRDELDVERLKAMAIRLLLEEDSGATPGEALAFALTGNLDQLPCT